VILRLSGVVKHAKKSHFIYELLITKLESSPKGKKGNWYPFNI